MIGKVVEVRARRRGGGGVDATRVRPIEYQQAQGPSWHKFCLDIYSHHHCLSSEEHAWTEKRWRELAAGSEEKGERGRQQCWVGCSPSESNHSARRGVGNEGRRRG
jgi:hypothetical protein